MPVIRRIVNVGALLALSAVACAAQEPGEVSSWDELDKKCGTPSESAPQLTCYAEASKHYYKRLRDFDAEQMKRLPENQKKIFVESQKAWTHYRDTLCNLIVIQAIETPREYEQPRPEPIAQELLSKRCESRINLQHLQELENQVLHGDEP